MFTMLAAIFLETDVAREIKSELSPARSSAPDGGRVTTRRSTVVVQRLPPLAAEHFTLIATGPRDLEAARGLNRHDPISIATQ